MFSLRKILVPVEFSERCAGSAGYVRGLADVFHCRVVLLHVVQPPSAGYRHPEVLAHSSVEQVYSEMMTHARDRMDAFLAEDLANVGVDRMVVTGEPAQQIVKIAAAHQADLILMPTHGFGPFRRFLLGSVVAKVLHDADCPVWTGVHLEGAASPGSFRVSHILSAVDLGPQSRAVLSWASGMASVSGAKLSIAHALSSLETIDGVVSEPEWRSELTHRAEEELEALRERVGAAAASFVLRGAPPQAIHDCATRLHADLVVIGRGATKGIVSRLRAHAYPIIRESPCPVVSV